VPAEGFYTVDQTDEPGSIAAVRSTDAVVANRTTRSDPLTRTSISIEEACACRVAFVMASATT
jgi:hypothetical protein